MGRRLVLTLAAALLALAAPASAHQPARVAVVSPRPGAQVSGTSLHVVLEGRGGRDAASFRLLLDGVEVDYNGIPGGSLFTTLRIGPGERQEYRVRLARTGAHELRVVPDTDTDSTSPQVVVRFSSGTPVPVAAGLAAEALLVAVVAGHGLLARRERRR